MLAYHKHSFGISTLSTAIICWCTVLSLSAVAQQPQPPSSRYQPVRNVPPSVHIPTANTQRLPQVGLTKDQTTAGTGSKLNFSDAIQTEKIDTKTGANRYTAQQVSYEMPQDNQENPSVPKLFQGTGNSLIEQETTLSRMNQSQPRQNTQQPDDRNQKNASLGFPSTTLVETTKPTNLRSSAATSFSPPAQTVSFGRSSGEDTSRTTTGSNGTDRKSTPKIISLSSPNPSSNKTTLPLQNTTPRNFDGGPMASAEQSSPTMELSAPAILVKTYGPDTIGINKSSMFRVTVTNGGGTAAKNLLIGIKLPQWVDIQNLQTTTGLFKITEGVEQARIVWTIDEIMANSTQTITIPATPRKAELFEMGVEWTFIPQNAKTSIAVTQPKLEMTVSGPDDILYGDKAVYQVEVRNPGTGTAEQVRVKLPEALGGESQSIGNIPPGDSQRFQIELFARTAGKLSLIATASASGELTTSVERKVRVRRANLEVKLTGPPKKYSGTDAKYAVTVTNNGDAIAHNVIAALAMPSGVEYLGGLDSIKKTGTGLNWNVGALNPGDSETYNLNFVLNTSGELHLEAGARGEGDLGNSCQFVTAVQTVADLTLSVVDPRGPLPTDENVTYEIRVKNRGSKMATNVNVVMHFANGIEPTAAAGMKNEVTPGEVAFQPIPVIEPGQELVLSVVAQAQQSGTHVFRAQLTCDDSDSREIAQGTTRFYAEGIENQAKDSKAPQTANGFSPTAGQKK